MCNAQSKTQKEGLINKKLSSTAFPDHLEIGGQASWACHALHQVFQDYALKNTTGASLCDIGACLAVLGNVETFKELFREFDQQYFAPCFAAFTQVEKNKVTSLLLYYLHNECGFKNVPEIVFFGKGDGFIPVVAEGMIFKDGLSAVHGEYAHALQWCVIGWAVKKGVIELSCPVVEVYKSLVSTHAQSHDNLVGEFGETKKHFLWDMVCDGLAKHGSHKSPDENILSNIYSESFRSPAYLTNEMLRSSLSATTLGQLLQARYQKDSRADFHGAVFKGEKAKETGPYTRQRQATHNNRAVDEVGQIAYPPDLVHGRPKNKKKDPQWLTPKTVKETVIASQPSVHAQHWAAWNGNLEPQSETGGASSSTISNNNNDD